MELLQNLFEGFPGLWGGGVAHSVLILSLVIALGLLLGKIKVMNVSLGLTWVLFCGIVFGHFTLNLDEHLLHFLKEFGLILFVYSLGLQVGPSFFSSFRKGGAHLNALAILTLAVSIVMAVTLLYIGDLPITTMAGILSGAVTNTPGLGAAQQAYSDLRGIDAPEIAMGYAVAYPMGVVGAILVMLLLRFCLRIDVKREEVEARRGLGVTEDLTVRPFTVRISHESIEGMMLHDVKRLIGRDFVVSRILSASGEGISDIVRSNTVFHHDDRLLIIANPRDIEPIIAFLGQPDDIDWERCCGRLMTRRILITKPELNGKTLAGLKIRTNFGVNVTRVNRSGVDLVASPHLHLQMGDRLTVVGTELNISHTERILGNEMKRLNYPNLIPIFLGIALGCILANIPLWLPGLSQPLKLGLTGGPLIVAILIGHYGPKHKLITYNTISANLMIREIGFCIFLACVGLGAGKDFIATVVNPEGMLWIGYGALITMVPLIVGGLFGRLVLHLNYYTLIGVLAGANTNPPALAYANDLTKSDLPAVGYATVYPVMMFLRIISIQLLVFILG
ncbi:MAG: putative transporter [Prevotella sp.]|nr:putative transporter [Prevotella sp.]